jgi:hypothetical protein
MEPRLTINPQQLKAKFTIIFPEVNTTFFPHFLGFAGIPRNVFLVKLSGLQIIQQNVTQH